ncbi:hypothetical protein TPHA_0C03630 [Tetrapisispora phaffii CBS 4417]|uniref:Zn(2)-C6 fungal-type domain-containing protein n=1 Tax=Tetrapisispora phaffii (strain ATCC 24235 / CBS 4417 / NBRC 1672 / NRRL Y-8282 / UCD 70-5) TaxID=1071381 RepID=G8BQK3_TETPH|nr:hypothetical protein TPHA_0C03630 [Tetrapisispora phaffii CBS 4417]CCE62515.1 hypothetical protein TPHA_0C03630 [Tetrapisispora phaffii CBS 4417]
MLGSYKSRTVCHECSKRKIKCDRLIPCRNCIKRNLQHRCIESNNGVSSVDALDEYELYKFYLNYESVVVDVGLFKTLPTSNEQLQSNDEFKLLFNNEVYSKLLDYTVTNLGCLYFGVVQDITELYDILHKAIGSDDNSYDDLLVWSLIALAVYFMDEHTFSDLMGPAVARGKLYHSVVNYIIKSLYDLNFVETLDVRFLQIVAVLSNTIFLFEHNNLYNNLLILSMNLLKYYKTSIGKITSHDVTGRNTIYLKLIKNTTNKIWYKFALLDYLQSNNSKKFSIHTEISSLTNEPVMVTDVDPFQEAESFDLLCWKIVSLDKDITHYIAEARKPTLKTLETLEKNIQGLETTVKLFLESNKRNDNISINSSFERFLLKFFIHTTKWKLYRIYYVHYDNTENSFNKMAYHTRIIISQLVKNVKLKQGQFNKFPIVLFFISKMITFYTFAKLVNSIENNRNHNDENEELSSDLVELLMSLPMSLNPSLEKVIFLVEKLNKLIQLFNKIRIADSISILKHPVMLILQNDINTINLINNKIPNLISSANLESLNDSLFDDYNYDNNNALENQSTSFKLIIDEFELKYNIKEIIRYSA